MLFYTLSVFLIIIIIIVVAWASPVNIHARLIFITREKRVFILTRATITNKRFSVVSTVAGLFQQ